MYGYIYLTTNLVNGKRYIGQKKSDVFLHEKYLGSGLLLKNSIKKYGKENFKVELIEECESEEQLNDREIYWISYYNACDSDDFYNIHCGGSGGDTLKGMTNEQREAHRQNVSKNHADMRGKNNPNYGNKMSEESKRRIGIANSKHLSERNRSRHFKHSEETKQKLREHHLQNRDKFSKTQIGRVKMKNLELNKVVSVYPEQVEYYESLGYIRGILKNGAGHNKGKIGQYKWVTNGIETKQIKSEELDYYLSNGYQNGRKFYCGSTTIESVVSEKNTNE